MVSKVVKELRTGVGLGINSLSRKLLFLKLYQQGKIGFRTFFVLQVVACRINKFILGYF